MKYTNIKLADLKTCEDCDRAIEQIESDYKNIHGGFSAWNSGRETYLLQGAVNKIETIMRKEERLFSKMIKRSYIQYCREAGPDAVEFEEYERDELYC